ncbi:MAG: NADH-quinone oxidoreductase subunit C [Opitutaceae bacterium]|jgi:NADH-quinone oxidoreductase subunit C
MSLTAEQLASELAPLAAADYIPLPPQPKPAPAAAKPAAASAADGAATPAPAPAPVAPPPFPPPPSNPIQVCDFAAKGTHLDATVAADKVVEAARIMDRHGFAIDAVTGMDWLAQDLMEVVYDYLHFQTGMRVSIRARLPRSQPRIATISKVFAGANWHEREAHDFFGIDFAGHPDLTPFLLPEDADYHPLRKDFSL